MNGLEIRAKLLEKGFKLKDIALETNVSISFVSMVIYGKKKSLKVQKLISKKLDEPYEKLWQNEK